MLSALATSSSGQASHRLGASRPMAKAGRGDQPGDRRQPRIPAAVGARRAGRRASPRPTRRREPPIRSSDARKCAGRAKVEAEAAHQHRRRPQGEAVAGRASCTRRRRRAARRRACARAIGKTLPKRRGVARRRPLGVSRDDQPQDRREQQPGDAHDDEGRAPVDRRGDIGADQGPRGEADRDAEREDGQRPGAPLRREIVGDRAHRRARLRPPRRRRRRAGRGTAGQSPSRSRTRR